MEETEAYGKLPLSFVENVGQANASIKFLARGPGYGLFLTPTEAVLTLNKPSAKEGERAVVRMKLLGVNEAPQVNGLEELAGKNHYFIGSDPAKWHINVSSYARVQYGDVYPGVDLVYYGDQRQLECDFVVAPGVNPRAIALGFKGVDRLEVDAAGELVLHTAGGEVRQHRPFAYQETDGARREVAANYVLKGEREIAFEVGEYDPSRPLVIDPVLVYSIYLGGGPQADRSFDIAIDPDGNAYVTGQTQNAAFPVTPGAFDVTYTNNVYEDAFVAKLNADGSDLLFATFLGVTSSDVGRGIAVDKARNVYVTGQTKSANFPLKNSLQPKTFGTDSSSLGPLTGGPSKRPPVFIPNPPLDNCRYNDYIAGHGPEAE